MYREERGMYGRTERFPDLLGVSDLGYTILISSTFERPTVKLCHLGELGRGQ